MKCCYVLSQSALEQAKGAFEKKFKNIAVFKINFSENEKDSFINADKSGIKEIFLNLMSEFDKFSKDCEFCIILGCEGFSLFGASELNLKIAKNLNAPIFEVENLSALRAINGNSKLLISDEIEQILAYNQNIITPYKFEKILIDRARALKSRVVLPESDDERVLKAAEILLKQKSVELILLGNENKIAKKASELGLNLSGLKIIDIDSSEHLEPFADKIYELRKAKGLSKEQARELARDYTYFGTMLVYEGLASAMVSGANTTTAATIRPALQIIKTKPGAKLVSGLFFVALDEEVLAYADCAITPNPNADELASIAVTSAQTAAAFGIEPKVAMLSYSTGNSGSGPSVDFVREATNLAKNLEPNLALTGPIQYDAAVDLKVASKKMPNDEVAGRANVFIFPDLSCGNICYKAVQRSANALAIGPILQGLKKPVNDLSRGCKVDDIVNTVLISAIQAGE